MTVLPPVLGPMLVVQGILLPDGTLRTTWFAVLATFVALNTVMYAALPLAKILPQVYPRDWLPRHYVRAQTRGIYPEGHPEGPPQPG